MGGREATYQPDGFTGHTIREFLLPIKQTFWLCRMHCIPPFLVYGTHAMQEDEMIAHAADYRLCIEALRDGRLDLDGANKRTHINADLQSLVSA